jgi:RNA-directed DNA polymerase
MKEPYVEGVANHDGPESCAGTREGVGEALTGVRTGRVLSREITQSRAPTPLAEAEGNTPGGVTASLRTALRGRRPLARAESSCARTGRSTSCPWRMVPRAASGRPEAGRR